MQPGALERLVLANGRNVYVEPTGYGWSEGELLIAGAPTVLWNEGAKFTSDTVFGVVVGRGSDVRLVDAPIAPRLLDMIEVLGRRGGGWDVVFGERFAPTIRDSIRGVWHGIHDGRRWTSLTQVPIPPGVRLFPPSASRLIRMGDTLAWAVRVQDRVRFSIDVLLLRNHGGQWTSEVVPTRRASYVAIRHSDEFGLELPVVAADTTARRDANSLFIWTKDLKWAIRRRISFAVEEGAAHHPTYVGSDPAVLTWYVDRGPRREVRTLVDPLRAPLDRTAVIDSQFADMGAVASFRLARGLHAWVTQHNHEGAGKQLRFVLGPPDRVHTAFTFASPYQTTIRTVHGEKSQIVVFGGVRHPENGGYSTALTRVRVICPR